MGMSGVVDFIFMASGAYLVGTAVMAKAQGKIAANVMLGKNVMESDIQDKMGFIEYMYKRLLLSGVLIIMASVLHLVNDYYIFSNILTIIGVLLIVAALIIYTRSYFNAQRRFMPHKAARFVQDTGKKGRRK